MAGSSSSRKGAEPIRLSSAIVLASVGTFARGEASPKPARSSLAEWRRSLRPPGPLLRAAGSRSGFRQAGWAASWAGRPIRRALPSTEFAASAPTGTLQNPSMPTPGSISWPWTPDSEVRPPSGFAVAAVLGLSAGSSACSCTHTARHVREDRRLNVASVLPSSRTQPSPVRRPLRASNSGPMTRQESGPTGDGRRAVRSTSGFREWQRIPSDPAPRSRASLVARDHPRLDKFWVSTGWSYRFRVRFPAATKLKACPSHRSRSSRRHAAATRAKCGTSSRSLGCSRRTRVRFPPPPPTK